jgi:hypothetical protein
MKKIKSEWRVSSNSINGERMYIAYRLLDVKAVDHSGNREYHGGYMISRAKAEEIARQLNNKEE